MTGITTGHSNGDRVVAAPGSSRHDVDETTSLLSGTTLEANKPINKAVEDGSDDVGSTGDGEITIVADELSTTRLVVIFGTTWVGVFLGAIDASIIATLSAPIASEFQSLSLLSWIATAYLIANAACQPLSGRMTDIFGRGPGLVFSNVLFSLGNLICGVAKNEQTMILGRAVFLAASSTTPPPGAGALPSSSRFPSVLSRPCWSTSSSRSLPRSPTSRSSRASTSWALSSPSPSSFSYSWVSMPAGGNVVPWTHPLVLISIPLSFIMLAGFIYWESRPCNTQPIIPVRLLAHRTVFTACVTNLMCTMVTMMLTFYVPIYLMVLGHTPTQAGLRLLASPLAVCFTSFGSGLIMKATGLYKALGIAVVSTLVAGVAVLTTLGLHTPGWIVFVALFLIGGGYGGMLTVTMVACIAAVDHSQQANILKTELWARFGDWPGAEQQIGRIRDDLGELNRLPLAWREGVMESFMAAFRGVWFTALGMAAAGLVAVSLMKQHKLHSTLTRRED
ncbi:major facilitator superfamily domain-containing protein [Sordaria sp. MPI-SDFR-AT-0083]|nr:major facilitator superfamily domain-containing protein [Sordaria sp. MPI-SDFR-AT-0083]